VARNRKRAKERRSRRPPGAQPGIATARAQREEATPDPLEHATPDVELAEAQLALGRPELAGGGESEGDYDDTEFEQSASFGGHAADADGEGGGPPRGGGTPPGGAGLAVPGASVPEGRPHAGNRLITFLQGSWRELQRVQWPDRRQVMQATGVVIGFVIVAGVFLGVADTVASKIMTFVLK
jgi:preprotein translocase SecE subunit